MASPGVIDGAVTPEDMYSPSKNAHCCGPSTECIVCMHACAHTSIHKRGRLTPQKHTENTIQESSNRLKKKKKKTRVGWAAARAPQPTTGTGLKHRVIEDIFPVSADTVHLTLMPQSPSLTSHPPNSNSHFTWRVYFLSF